ncbi:MAG TPA: hypothetical protein VMB18_16355 [Terriglobales bacterium]|nr:hypothetical protein [Terriglobales bacterium]
MRLIGVFCGLLLLCGLAAGQATVIGGTASNWVPAYGVYAAPYVPLVTTPSVTLATVSPMAVGASNATWGNVAGATNATLSDEFIGAPPVGVYTEPNWYGPSAPIEAGPAFGAGMYPPPRPRREHRGEAREEAFDFVAAGSESIATSRAGASAGRKASRTYTNQDADRMNDTNGLVKWDGKTEHI